MSVGKIIEITAEPPESFEHAIRQGIEKAAQTVHNIKSAWVKEQQVIVNNNKIIAFKVDLKSPSCSSSNLLSRSVCNPYRSPSEMSRP